MIKGLGGFGDMAKMMSAARDMQGKVEEFQKSLEAITVTGEAGIVKVLPVTSTGSRPASTTAILPCA